MLNHKRILSLILAGAMSAALAVPAFAAETPDYSNRTTKVTAGYEDVKIEVVVPTEGTVYINPYALPVKVGTGSSTDVKLSQQIATKPLLIRNRSEVALNVNISAETQVEGQLTTATSSIADVTTDTKNDAFMYVAVVTSGLAEAEDYEDSAIADDYATVSAKLPAYDETKMIALSSTKVVSKTNMAVLAKSTMDTDGTFSKYAAGSTAYVVVTGNCAQSPKSAWTAADKATINLTFTFTPNVATTK
jgi:hypothetical protein